MKKILIIVLIILLIALGYFVVVTGLDIGSFKIFGIQDLKEENDQIDQKIEQATTLTSTDYQKVTQDIDTNAKQLVKVKQDYEDLTKYSSNSETGQGIERESYEVEYLYKQLGTYATEEGLDIDLQVTTATTPNTTDGRSLYDITFTAKGPYIGIALFISDIENDSTLEFKVENFKMQQQAGELQATFTVKNVPINLGTLTTTPTTNSNTGNNTNTTNTNTAGNNTTNTTNTNTTNTTNTAS